MRAAWPRRLLAPGLALALLASAGLGSSPVRSAPPVAPPPPSEPAPLPGQRPCAPARSGERFEVDFDGVPLGSLARLVSCAGELNLIFDPPALGVRQVTVVATMPVPLPDLLALFARALGHEGLVMARRGGFTVIRPAASEP